MKDISKMEEENCEGVKNLQAMTEYQSDSIVSKSIIGKKSGNVTLFAFDKGQGLSEHTAPFDAMVYLIDGKAKVTLSGNDMNIEKGDIVILPANKPHALLATEKFKMMLVMIKSVE
jgi:quercetin dioxygenase-like cupin family protein